MKFDVFKIAEKIPSDFLKRKVLDNVISVAIPFNLSLGMHIKHLSKDRVEVTSNAGWKTKNHVGGAHACFIALMGEYPAGLLLAQNYSPENFRMIIAELHADYHKQVRGFLKSVARRPEQLPEAKDGEAWVEMLTDLFDKDGNAVATVKTKWQLKEWNHVKAPS